MAEDEQNNHSEQEQPARGRTDRGRGGAGRGGAGRGGAGGRDSGRGAAGRSDSGRGGAGRGGAGRGGAERSSDDRGRSDRRGADRGGAVSGRSGGGEAATAWSRDGSAGPRPPRRRTVGSVVKPLLPAERPRLERAAWGDLRSNVAPGQLDDVARAFGAAGDALEDDDVDRAVELLRWAKSAGARSPAIREALGIALYLRGDFATASSELLAYQRLSGRKDQNHLLADCARAAGRPDKVQSYVAQMDPREVGVGRWVEGLIVLAGDRADRGDLRAAMATLERAGLEPQRIQDWHPRLWYAAGDLAERSGDRARARELFEAILAVDPEFLDVDERLAALDRG